VSEKRKKQIGWNTRAAMDRLERDSEFLNKQIGGLVKELDLNRENWQGSNELVLAETQLKYMKLHANALNLRIVENKGEIE
jgi:hypothetical protein